VINRSLARRYARALMDLAEEDPAKVADRLMQFNQLLKANPALKEILISPAFRPEERKNVFSKVFELIDWGRPLDRFLEYLVEKRRVSYLDAIAECFLEMVDEKVGRVRVKLESAVAIDDQSSSQLKKALVDGLKQEVVIDKKVDSSLLAGVSVRVGDLVIDGSMKTKLNSLRNTLVAKH
jgi:F-type H+-transporting ATPase subunit delta